MFHCRYFPCVPSLELCNSIRQHLAKCLYREQCVKRTDGMGVKRKSNERPQTGDGDHDGESDVYCKKIREIEEGQNVQREPPTEKAVVEFCLIFWETSLQLVSREVEDKFENITQLNPDASFDAREHRRHVEEVDDCGRLLADGRIEALAPEYFAKQIVRAESGPLPSGAILIKTNVSAFLRSQMIVSLSQYMFFSSQDVLTHVGHPVAALHKQDTKMTVQERVTRSAKRDVCWTSESRVFAEVVC